MRKGCWKLIRFFEDRHEELYNLRQDIGKTANLADAEPGKREELSAALIPEPNPTYVPWEGRVGGKRALGSR